MSSDSIVEKIARAVLYEGYLLYPYRRSSLKNRQPWSFGTLLPQSWSEPRAEKFRMESQCLATVNDATQIAISIRFLQLSPANRAQERRVLLPAAGIQDLLRGVALPFSFAIVSTASSSERATGHAWPSSHPHPFLTGNGTDRERCSVSTDRIEGLVQSSLERLDVSTAKITLRVKNLSRLSPELDSDQALLHSLVAAHAVLEIQNGEFVSLLDPPTALGQFAAGCVNVGVFPVLVGEPGQRDTMLVSPIILYDYPEIAPESPGEFFDSTEIDEMLSLRVLTLSDEEKRELRTSGDEGRAILERTEELFPQQWEKIHGAIRGLRRVSAETSRSWASASGREHPGEGARFHADQSGDNWNPFADVPTVQSVTVFGVELRKGDRVRLWPQHGESQRADIFDLVLAGKIGIIEAIEQDFESQIHLAVLLEDDPGRDLGELRQPGHRFFFRPGEVEPLALNIAADQEKA
ncbi:MAG TPA: hypothetical protein VFQ00_13660 [Terriglobales bacterium]|nr:hypothetical protein [Terriglobales bacterium]